jgi:hypothetical protein
MARQVARRRTAVQKQSEDEDDREDNCTLVYKV